MEVSCNVLFLFFINLQKQEKRRELRLKKFWRSPKTTSSEDSGGCESPTKHQTTIVKSPQQRTSPPVNKPTCSLPLLQVWPSQDSPRGEADGQSFIFPALCEDEVSVFTNICQDFFQIHTIGNYSS